MESSDPSILRSFKSPKKEERNLQDFGTRSASARSFALCSDENILWEALGINKNNNSNKKKITCEIC